MNLKTIALYISVCIMGSLFYLTLIGDEISILNILIPTTALHIGAIALPAVLTERYREYSNLNKQNGGIKV